MAKFKFPAKIKSLDELPEAFRALGEQVYEKDGDEFFFEGTDDEGVTRLRDDFRSNNRKKHKELEELKAQLASYKDVDVEKYPAAMAALSKLQAMQEKELLDKGQVDEVVRNRVAVATDPLNQALKQRDEVIKSLTADRDNYRTELHNKDIDSLVTRAASAAGQLKKGALPHLLKHGRDVWKVPAEGGPPVPYKNGEIWYGKDAVTPLTEQEWGAKLLEEQDFFFEPSKGGGSSGNGKTPTENGTRVVGNVKYIDRSNPVLMGKYHKEILEGTVIPQ